MTFWYFKDYSVAGLCTVDGKDNKEDKTREEADMIFSPFFFNKCQKRSKVIQKMGNGNLKYGFGLL